MVSETHNTYEYKDRMLVVSLASKQTGAELVKLKAVVVKTAEKFKEDIDILVDVSKVVKSDEHANPMARKFFEKLPFRKMAVFGGKPAVNVGIRLIVNLFISKGVGEVKIFGSQEKALRWLRNGN